MTDTRFGVKASAEQFSPRDLVELAVLAEEVGFDSVMVSDHLQPWRDTGGHAPFSLAWMAAVGERTRRVSLGTSVLTPTFRYAPAVIAQAFATLGCLYPGRIILGVGTGEALNEYAGGFTGPWPPFRERLARLREAAEVIRRLWNGETVDFDGAHVHARNAKLYDLPTEPVPLYIAAGGPRVARFAGEVGDGFICTSGKGMELYTEQLLPAVSDGAASAGRPEGDRMIEIKISYDRDLTRARENTRFWAPLSLSAEQKHSISSPREMEAAADTMPIEQIARRWIVASTAEEAMAGIDPYLRAGFTHLVFHGPGFDQQRFLTQFSEDVLPLLRA